MKNKFIKALVISFCIIPLIMIPGQKGLFAGDTMPVKEKDIDPLVPRKIGGTSLFTTLALDILPGGGHFYRGDYPYGIGFALLKAGGGMAIYFCYNNFSNARDTYNNDRSLGNERSYDSAAQGIVFAVIANVIIYTASAIINYNDVTRINERAIPSFQVAYSVSHENHENRYSILYTFKL
ncbi:MAG: hypothetical protein GY754_34040 [bacterium]|nr:hypothetical protein [bacterium]